MHPILPALAVALLLAGCGGGDTDPDAAPSSTAPEPTTQAAEPEQEPAEPEIPACDDVWVDGATLPKNYEGCMNGGVLEAPSTIECDSGIGTFATYDDRFWALLGGKISEGSSDGPKYAQAYEDCFTDPS